MSDWLKIVAHALGQQCARPHRQNITIETAYSQPLNAIEVRVALRLGAKEVEQTYAVDMFTIEHSIGDPIAGVLASMVRNVCDVANRGEAS